MWNVGTTYTFTNGGAIGADANSTFPNYAPAPFYPDHISMPRRGYQYLTIANAGTYELTCYGSAGGQGGGQFLTAWTAMPGPGTPGPGGIMRGSVSLNVSDVLILCVGQIGLWTGFYWGGGGGGMSAIFLSSLGTGTPLPLIVAAGGGGSAGNGSGSSAGNGSGGPPTNYNGFGPSNTWESESILSNLQGTDGSIGSATQVSAATVYSTSTFSYGLIDYSGTRLSGVGSTNIASSAGGWGGGGCGGGGSGVGGGGGGWRGSTTTRARTGGSAGTNFARTTLTAVSYVGDNSVTGSITIQRIS
jgi:hypothetical protein